MSRLRGRAKLVGVLGACAAAAALLGAGCGGGGKEGKQAAPAATTGALAPLAIKHPDVPIIGGGVAVELEPTVDRTDLGATLSRLPGAHRVKLTIFNSSNIGAIHSLQWYPPVGSHIVRVLDSTGGRCRLTGITGFGGAQFPGVVLNPNVLCEGLDLAAPTCMCRGDGGEMALSLEMDRDISVGSGELRLRSATVSYSLIPVSPDEFAQQQGGKAAGAGSAPDGDEAQDLLDALRGSNLPLQLIAISQWVQNPPSTCRVRRADDDPARYDAYVFWTPWLAAQPYVWLTMSIPADPAKGAYALGTADPVLPGGKLNRDGRTINPASVDTTLLARYGAEQAKKGKALMVEHAGSTLQPDGQDCQLLKDGSLRVLPAAG